MIDYKKMLDNLIYSKISRRDFLKVLSMILISKNAFAKSNLEQKIKINLPAYSLTLMNFLDGELKKSYTFPVSIGKGCRGRKQTPIGTGVIYDKRKKVIFRYGENHPHLNIKEDDIIKWTNTFDKHGNPIGYPMPYSNMRGLGMKLKNGSYYHYDFVIHSTTDEFTIGTPSSKGCIRVGIEDMLWLYAAVRPEVKSGKLRKSVPVEINYDLIEFDRKKVKLHADIYKTNFDYVKGFEKLMIKAGFNHENLDYSNLNKEFALASEDFCRIHEEILDVLSNDHPKNFVHDSLKKRLHKDYDVSCFLK